ncbi:tetratricopeptide repeat protein [Desulfobulbus oligotrophicus]|uniref:Tetratricopeptide repeat protein n=1 Tax=Desulfobulbus oligotrophicus TaxID=1909699 RepID=A0A7T5VCI2_9BACT|nr:hypothetical protein [Desulfobulbus oligotrophicus]QQG65368.1 hypothetical protein HP555_05555 [Desulfobulbus oligotrophicus]
MSDESKIAETGTLEARVRELEAQIESLSSQLKPDSLAKRIDSSYLSTNNLRVFLQILALIQTVFVAGAIAFGFVGFTNIMAIRTETEKVREAGKTIENSVKRAAEAESTIRTQVAAFDERLKRVDATFGEKQKQMDQKLVLVQTSVDNATKTMQRKTEDSLNSMKGNMDQRLADAEKEIRKVNKQLSSISTTFNKVGISNEKILSAREKQLLFLLAKEIDPDNPIFNFNTGILAFSFGRYDEAIIALDKVIKAQNVPSNIITKAKETRSTSMKLKQSPPEVKANEPKGVAIGDYVILQLHLNSRP